jgi:hypothetical protein
VLCVSSATTVAKDQNLSTGLKRLGYGHSDLCHGAPVRYQRFDRGQMIPEAVFYQGLRL